MAGSSNRSSEPNPEANKVLDSRMNEFIYQTDELEKRVKTVVQYYESNKGLTDGAHDKSAHSKRMQDFMRQFGIILRKIMNYKLAFPFIKPVDAEGLGLHDYYEVIKKPMDLGTILNRMEAKEYKNVSDICADVRLVFDNAMQYNGPGTHVHNMAKELQSVFEKKWHQLSLKIAKEERRREENKIREAAIEKLAQDTDKELMELSMQLEELRRNVMQRCRKMNTKEKMMLTASLGKLSVEDLNKAIEIAAKYDPYLDVSSDNVDVDLDSLNGVAQWRVYYFVQNALKRREKEQRTKMEKGSKKNKV